MNCFQISIFAVANTTQSSKGFGIVALWIAFKLVSLQLQTQQILMCWSELNVVNCFQISIFAVANTTSPKFASISKLLWIAFKLVSLQLQTQPLKSLFLVFSVVNCFQISIFAVANTTYKLQGFGFLELWIAFKLVSLQLQTQLRVDVFDENMSCELLSN